MINEEQKEESPDVRARRRMNVQEEDSPDVRASHTPPLSASMPRRRKLSADLDMKHSLDAEKRYPDTAAGGPEAENRYLGTENRSAAPDTHYPETDMCCPDAIDSLLLDTENRAGIAYHCPGTEDPPLPYIVALAFAAAWN